MGWRGYLLPLLTERFGFRRAAFMTGGVWALWHYPLLLLPGFITKPKSAMEMTFFTGMVIGLSFVIGWLRMKTQSIWPCVLLHAAHNGFLETVFDPSPRQSERRVSSLPNSGQVSCLRSSWLVWLWRFAKSPRQRNRGCEKKRSPPCSGVSEVVDPTLDLLQKGRIEFTVFAASQSTQCVGLRGLSVEMMAHPFDLQILCPARVEAVNHVR